MRIVAVGKKSYYIIISQEVEVPNDARQSISWNNLICSVTRFGEIWPLWLSFKNLWLFWLDILLFGIYYD